ncbi:MAG: hypothetical protein STHCBS139747_007923 [Sporothrix thermara]
MSNIKMLVVDFDRSSVGAALLAAVNEANGRPTNPTYEICSSALAGGADLCAKPEQIRDAVFAGKYWGAVYAAAGVTAQYQATIAGTNTTPYNASSAYVLYGNSARYAAFYPAVVLSNLQAIVEASSAIFMQQTSAPLLATLSSNGTVLSAEKIQALLTPLGSTYTDTSYGSFTFGDRTVFNTLLIVVVVLCQFFFLMSLNGLSLAFKRFDNVSAKDYFKWRVPISISWALFGGLCITAWQLTFKEEYPINARLVFSLWTLYWVFAMIVFDVLDIVTAFVPPQFVPFCMFTWMITNVTSAGAPLELSNVFYRVSYFFPAHAMWLAEQHIWSQGGAYRLSISLPILAAWLVVAKTGTIFTLAPRRKLAALAKKGGPPGGPPGGPRRG